MSGAGQVGARVVLDRRRAEGRMHLVPDELMCRRELGARVADVGHRRVELSMRHLPPRAALTMVKSGATRVEGEERPTFLGGVEVRRGRADDVRIRSGQSARPRVSTPFDEDQLVVRTSIAPLVARLDDVVGELVRGWSVVAAGAARWSTLEARHRSHDDGCLAVESR